jgi:lipopolysaccharide export LptBFGC system permease protein LptF
MYIKLFLIFLFSFLTIIFIILIIKKQSKIIIKPEIDYHLGDGIFTLNGYAFIFEG